MSSERFAIRIDVLLIFLVAYAAAGLFHYSHNAEFLDEYPNMPAWLSRAQVYTAWLGVTAVGVVGFVLYRSSLQLAGLLLLGLYAALGFDGLLHYTRAPFGAHTSVMNFTIWFEGATAAVLLLAVVWAAAAQVRRDARDT